MEKYIVRSLETHLFFARIMKEHAFFLEAGFVCADTEWVKKADLFRQQFEELLRDAVKLSNGRIHRRVLDSGELVTEFTIPAETRTEQLSGVKFDQKLTKQEQNLNFASQIRVDRELFRNVHALNVRAIKLLDGLICFKESILEEVKKCKLFTFNYPLLIAHILREAKLYRETVEDLMNNRDPFLRNPKNTEEFWNQIMMEHALFIRGSLDPTECTLIQSADQFAGEYEKLLEQTRKQDCRALGMTEEALEETRKFRKFKAAGTEGILKCEISSLIIPLLADHVLREANHYIRLLESGNWN